MSLNLFLSLNLVKLILGLTVIIAIAMLVLFTLIGYNLYKGGKEINNDKISKAGLYWLILVAVSVIIIIINYMDVILIMI